MEAASPFHSSMPSMPGQAGSGSRRSSTSMGEGRRSSTSMGEAGGSRRGSTSAGDSRQRGDEAPDGGGSRRGTGVRGLGSASRGQLGSNASADVALEVTAGLSVTLLLYISGWWE